MEDVTSLTVGHYGMMIVMPVFIGLAILCYVLTPKEWKASIQEKTAIIVFHVCGCAALSGLTWWYCDMPDCWLKWFLSFFQTFYMDFLLASNLILLLVKLARVIYKKIAKDKARHWNYRRIWMTVLCFIGFLCFFSIYHDDTVITKDYNVESKKEVPAQNMSIGLYADSHIGAGATIKTLGYATDRLTTINPDILILDGDIVDGTTGKKELEFMTSTLKNINPKYGKYFIMGNHDDNCLYDFEAALKDAGVIILNDEAVVLGNGAILVGKDNGTSTDPKTIMENCLISEQQQQKSQIILAQHRPERAELYKDQVDMMLCGHTHGNHFPKVNPLSIFTDKLVYGEREYDNMTAITTSGLSSWGFHTKWPSFSEVVEINICNSSKG